jgi:DNA-binding beta-propeller fold protein YncE
VGVAVDGEGAVYVVDSNNHRVQKFSETGVYLTQWGGLGGQAGRFDHPNGIAVDSNGNVYVTDPVYERIQKFTSQGGFLTMWSGHGHGICVDANDTIWIGSGHPGGGVRHYSADGVLLTQWTVNGSPDGVAVDRAGNVFVADNLNHRILKYSSSGTILSTWGEPGSGAGQLNLPVRLATNPHGFVYVVEHLASRVQVFDNEGGYAGQWGTAGSALGQFANPTGIAVGAGNRVYVADTNNSRIQVFGEMPTSTGAVSWGQLKARFR